MIFLLGSPDGDRLVLNAVLSTLYTNVCILSNIIIVVRPTYTQFVGIIQYVLECLRVFADNSAFNFYLAKYMYTFTHTHILQYTSIYIDSYKIE